MRISSQNTSAAPKLLWTNTETWTSTSEGSITLPEQYPAYILEITNTGLSGNDTIYLYLKDGETYYAPHLSYRTISGIRIFWITGSTINYGGSCNEYESKGNPYLKCVYGLDEAYF